MELMIDIETVSTRPDAAIMAIGACKFDISTGEIGETFYTAVDLDSCFDLGMRADGGTLEFWMSQDTAVAAKLFENTMPVYTALRMLYLFAYKGIDGIWSHSSFDPVILEHACRLTHNIIPWAFRQIRDVRTLVWLGRQAGLSIPEKPDDAHYALADAVHQAKYCSVLYQQLVKGETETDMTEIDIVFDRPPSHESGRLIEVERSSDHRGLDVGTWLRSDDCWALRLSVPTASIKGVS